MTRAHSDLTLDRLSRRAVLQGAGAVTGLVLCLRVSGAIAAEEARKYGVDASPVAR